ncbi:hypothetical protein [Eubacterium sp. AF19-12LB]|uniref:hypothetical protein n=1 Tax=Eubacterium sp. AF19-12LB TaxID=2293106 RepID=UPI000E4D7DCB|nr:hypothetical protein [Eubacterium sp. AF19-12LB]RHR33798.1 hypothetical protein DWX29_09305 [Eubacterium sp. AF19-12LB]
MRKYMAEFGLNVSTGYKTLIPVESLQKVNDGHNYHIYFILACSKIFIKPESICLEKKCISLIIYRIFDGNEAEIENVKMSLNRDIDHRKLKVNCKYPYTQIEIELENKNTITIDSQAISNYAGFNRKWNLEVLYIGQAYGKNGQRLAQDRLKTHNTLSTILSDCNMRYPDKRIYIFLLEVNPILNSVMDGINGGNVANIEEDRHFFNIFANPPQMNQIINIAEAALINYFKPKYNINFKENFPNKNHKGYKQYFELDYNSIMVELDLDFDAPYPNISLFSETNVINRQNRILQYNLDNDANRDNMYSIFKESK